MGFLKLMRILGLVCVLTRQTWVHPQAHISQEDIFDCMFQASQTLKSVFADSLDQHQEISVEEVSSPIQPGTSALFKNFLQDRIQSYPPVPNRLLGLNPQLSFLSLFTNSPPQSLF